ncbi:MAG: sigma-70 family RNA polymerase sigma factor [Clostridiales bacterium]|nr:sigma-70 family RNA polymerase sigma factor [Clostridiales bacterium]
MTDEFTLRRAQKGDAQAFEQLVTPHEQMLWRVCYHYTHHQEDAADCLQEAMLKAWRAIGSYRGDCALSSWLYRIASTVCLDFLRKQKRLPPTESADELAEDGFMPIDASPTPDEAVLRAESAEDIRVAMDSLPGEMRTVIILYALQGLSYEEIAEVMNTSVGTVKSRLNRARQKLARFLSDPGNKSSLPTSEQVKGGRHHG